MTRETLRREPFDATAMRTAMTQTRAARQNFDQVVQGVFAGTAAQMSQAGRHALADWPPGRKSEQSIDRLISIRSLVSAVFRSVGMRRGSQAVRWGTKPGARPFLIMLQGFCLMLLLGGCLLTRPARTGARYSGGL